MVVIDGFEGDEQPGCGNAEQRNLLRYDFTAGGSAGGMVDT